ncbi:MAG: isoprenoid biosynthesis protein ElbB [Ignavibacteriae bacterium HGW-Ignavibacteriae-4]|jgi:enhancing lycopene biosynthesis protein 2|nr:MAG: isoprenoid biosynthesis protein ElbB [Ignavibacteriae bacterium HGW-Ignavibacteriae-4]
MKIGVLLSGCGVYDGSEIHESVFTLLAIEENGAEAICFAPDKDQAHVINHIDGSVEQGEKRNVLKESARIARGNIKSINKTSIDDFDALVIPGGFGAAKNLNRWAFEGPDGDIDPAVKHLIIDMISAKKPIAALCMGPTVIAKALQGSGIGTKLTVGTNKEKSPYDIKEISDGMESLGVMSVMKTIDEICYDEENKIVTAPCYMMQASISQVRINTKQAIDKLISIIKK